MQTVFAVVGAAYGDEGKGLLTDALAHQGVLQGQTTVVVRFNGGAQAGHTVESPNGVRHVFHHWGAGALAGAATHLGPRFVVHPMLFEQEALALKKIGKDLLISVDPRARVTLPFDIMINQAVEASRGHNRHGSCGVGFGETCERNEHPGFGLTMTDLVVLTDVEMMDFLVNVSQTYVPRRLKALGLPADALDKAKGHGPLLERFIRDCKGFLKSVRVATLSQMKKPERVIFEGAQGLALDEDLGAFPFVTRSKTGLPYVLEMMEEAHMDRLLVTYVTRAYTTRHGAGPLPYESALNIPRFSDPTNQPNLYQGALRFAPLDTESLCCRMSADRARAGAPSIHISWGLMVSCLDQVADEVEFAGGERVAREKLGAALQLRTGAQWALESHGPTRETLDLSHLELEAAKASDWAPVA